MTYIIYFYSPHARRRIYYYDSVSFWTYELNNACKFETPRAAFNTIDINKHKVFNGLDTKVVSIKDATIYEVMNL